MDRTEAIRQLFKRMTFSYLIRKKNVKSEISFLLTAQWEF